MKLFVQKTQDKEQITQHVINIKYVVSDTQ